MHCHTCEQQVGVHSMVTMNIMPFKSLEEISTQNGPSNKNNKIIFIKFGGRKEKKLFFVHIFNISLRVFTQILSGISPLMRN